VVVGRKARPRIVVLADKPEHHEVAKRFRSMLGRGWRRGNLYQAAGGVGNAFFFVGPDEVLVIDATRRSLRLRPIFQKDTGLYDPVKKMIIPY